MGRERVCSSHIGLAAEAVEVSTKGIPHPPSIETVRRVADVGLNAAQIFPCWVSPAPSVIFHLIYVHPGSQKYGA